MAGLRKLSVLRHAAVGITVLGTGALGAAGVLGGGWHPERYDAWQVVVEPAGGDGVRIREVYDQDFGSASRHGHERTIPNDFGEPTGIRVSSPDAPDDLDVEATGQSTRIRIGDPDTTISGQHRYVLEYSLPEARRSTGFLALDLIDAHQFDVGQAQIVITGFTLENPRCFVGTTGSTERCAIEREADAGDDTHVYRARLNELRAGEGVTIDATIVAIGPAADVPLPDLPARRGGSSPVLGAGLGVLSLATAAPIYVWARRRGRNEVFAGGAADAAFGDLPSPGTARSGPPAVGLVSDDDLPDLATIEFVPPEGIDPWEAAVLLSERFGDVTVANYLSGLAGVGAISIAEVDGDLTLGRGPNWAVVTDPGELDMLNPIWELGDPYVVKGSYNASFAKIWTNIRSKLARRIETSGWWRHGAPTKNSAGAGVAGALVACVLLPIAIGVGAATELTFLRRWPVAIAFAIVLPAIAALCAYATMVPSRTATGSALALRAESFRRFLAASEGRHVEWAWRQGLLREYSAWAVALGAADAWSKALEAANVPEPQLYTAPLMLYSHRSDLTSTYTKPSSSSSSGGGFSGGSVGGGGGGGSSGSW